MAKDDEIKFTIAIPTYDRPRKLERAVRSAIVAANEADSGTFEVIIIEQSPNHWKPPHDIYHFIRTITSESGSVARARNLAFRDCRSDIIIFLDDDCVATKNWVSGYLEFLTEQEHCSVVFGSVLPVKHPQNQNYVLDVTETKFGTEWRGVSEDGDQCFALANFANEICEKSALEYLRHPRAIIIHVSHKVINQ
jgi:glycosyltransferase involved in cell wall biosynthesis